MHTIDILLLADLSQCKPTQRNILLCCALWRRANPQIKSVGLVDVSRFETASLLWYYLISLGLGPGLTFYAMFAWVDADRIFVCNVSRSRAGCRLNFGIELWKVRIRFRFQDMLSEFTGWSRNGNLII